MSDNERFLSRWSRLKQEAKQPVDDQAQAPAPADAGAAIADATEHARTEVGVPHDPQAKTLDLESLPPVDMIEATTDVRAFLSKGVPADLTKAALRRAWAADPAIRDFVGLSENAWNFNAPETIPGFGGTIPADEVARILAQMMSPAPNTRAESKEGAARTAEVPQEENKGEAEPAHPSGITPHDEKHALVKIDESTQPAAIDAELKQPATIENNKEDVASQNENKG